jgi:hypothetical protein
MNRYYAVAAVDGAGNVSGPSAVVVGRAYDEALPAIPTLTAAWVPVVPPSQAHLNWTSTDETRLEYHAGGDMFWTPIGKWHAPGAYDDILNLDTERIWVFRLRVRRSTGATAFGPPVTLDHL